MSVDADPEHQRDWQLLHDKITEVVDLYGVKDPFEKGDYWLLDENWGNPCHQLEFQNLDLFQPALLAALQDLLHSFSGWYITIRVDLASKKDEWPGMGVIIYRDRIVDDLRREFLPPRFRDVMFGEPQVPDSDRIAERVRDLMTLTQAKRRR